MTNLLETVTEELQAAQFIDMHTHLFRPSLGTLGLWGIDELLTYHYLEAELFRSSEITPEQYWSMSKKEQADAIWRTLFVDHLPVSEATRGVVAVLQAFGLPTESKDLREARAVFQCAKDRGAHREGVSACGHQRSGDDERSARSGRSSALGKRRRAAQGISRGTAAGSHFEQVDRALAECSSRRGTRSSSTFRRKAFARCGVFWTIGRSACSRSTWRCRCRTLSNIRRRARARNCCVRRFCRRAASLGIPLSTMIGVRYQVNPAIKLAGRRGRQGGSAGARKSVRAISRTTVFW